MNVTNWWKELGSPYPRNQTLQWCDTDNESNFRPGRYGRDEISYEFNSQGLRSIELRTVPGRINILVSGCSHTMGIGLPLEHTWPQLLSEMIPGSVVHNVAQGGASTDYVARSIFVACQIIQPDLIFVLWPEPSRMEYFDAEAPHNIQVTNPQYPKLLLEHTHHHNTYLKNRLMVKMTSGHIPLYHGVEALSRSPDGAPTARDGAHNCEVWHRRMALAFYVKYSTGDTDDRFVTAQQILDYVGEHDY